MAEKTSAELLPTGIPGFDDILRGGLVAGKMYLVSGGPGTGKTTLSLQFIEEGIKRREHCLYVTVGVTSDEILETAHAVGIALDTEFITFHTVEISREILDEPERRIFHSSEMELSGVMKEILAEVQRVKPKRLVIDALSDLQLLAEDLLSYRRLILAMHREFSEGNCTVLILNHEKSSEVDLHLETLCHGVINLQQVVHGYGPSHRKLLVLKYRGRAYRSGWHDFAFGRGGIRLFPTLVPGEHKQAKHRELVSSGNAELDALLCGGLNRGSSTALIGASGTGKTSLANLYVVAAARRGEYAVVYLFDESEESYIERADGMGLGVDEFMAQGLVTISQVGVGQFSSGEFISMVRSQVENMRATTIVIDTLGGYASAMDEKYLNIQLHELLTYLAQKGVTALLTVEQHGIFGNMGTQTKDVSYLADTILLLRFFEHKGSVRRAISVIKKRRGKHETTIRDLFFTDQGIVIGEPLTAIQGILTGVPTLE